MTVQELNNVFGKNVKFYRRIKGMSQPMIAEKIGVNTITICNWETGKQMIRAEQLVLLAMVLEVDVYELFYTGKKVLVGKEKLERMYAN